MLDNRSAFLIDEKEVASARWESSATRAGGERSQRACASVRRGSRTAGGFESDDVPLEEMRFMGLENHLLAGSRSARGRPRSSSRSRLRLGTGPCRALGADTPRDAELRGDLACSRLGSERKYVKRIYARDTGKARRQFAR